MRERLNIGCGRDAHADWVNGDAEPSLFLHDERIVHADLRNTLPWRTDSFDYVVANHVLSDLTPEELQWALRELRRVTQPEGVLRVLVPDAARAFIAWQRDELDWFPQDERTAGRDARLCTFLTWFGESRSVFTLGYLVGLLDAAGWSDTARSLPGRSYFLPGSSIVELDGDRTTALVVEARK